MERQVPAMQTSISGEPAAPHHVGIALRAMLFGTLMGAGLVALTMWGARTVQAGAAPVAGSAPPSPVFGLVVGGTLAGLGLAVAVAWSLMRPLRSAYRRGGLAIVAGFATFLAMLPTMAVDQLLGRSGLLGFAAACVLGCLLLAPKVAAGMRQT
jgi:hypothetical protein